MLSLYIWPAFVILFLFASFCCLLYSLSIRYKFNLHDRLLTKIFKDSLRNPYRFKETDNYQIASLSREFKFSTFMGLGSYFIGMVLFLQRLNVSLKQANTSSIFVTILFMSVGILCLILAQIIDRKKMILQMKAYQSLKSREDRNLLFHDFFESNKPNASVRRNQINLIGLLFLLAMLFCVLMYFNTVASAFF